MIEYICFGALSVPLILISRRSLLNPKSHGFYRFFSWECILLLLIVNYKYWFVNPLGTAQIFSWIFLIYSLILLIPGITLMKKIGKPATDRQDHTLHKFEKTTELIETGIFKYVRHPLYGSLLFLTWGICLKNSVLSLIVISILSSIFLFVTAKIEERENIGFFGERYIDYIKRSKMFVPYLF
jgi:protein-S-isoprenylcysteine O-methyltransferase Ste14